MNKKIFILIVVLVIVAVSFCLYNVLKPKTKTKKIENSISLQVDKDNNLIIINAQAFKKDINYKVGVKGIDSIELCLEELCDNYDITKKEYIIDDKILAGEIAYQKIYSYKIDEKLEDNVTFYLK